jgi:hypothetical protein
LASNGGFLLQVNAAPRRLSSAASTGHPECYGGDCAKKVGRGQTARSISYGHLQRERSDGEAPGTRSDFRRTTQVRMCVDLCLGGSALEFWVYRAHFRHEVCELRQLEPGSACSDAGELQLGVAPGNAIALVHSASLFAPDYPDDLYILKQSN